MILSQILHLFNINMFLGLVTKWPLPSVSVCPTGFRGQVTIKGQTFTGLLVCRSKTQAHQEVAKIALERLARETANDQVNMEASGGQTHKSESVSPAGDALLGHSNGILLRLDNEWLKLP